MRVMDEVPVDDSGTVGFERESSRTLEAMTVPSRTVHLYRK